MGVHWRLAHSPTTALKTVVVRHRVPKGTVDAVLSYCHNTLNDKTLVDLLPYFAEKGVGVISASVTSMGLFTKQVAHAGQPGCPCATGLMHECGSMEKAGFAVATL